MRESAVLFGISWGYFHTGFNEGDLKRSAWWNRRWSSRIPSRRPKRAIFDGIDENGTHGYKPLLFDDESSRLAIGNSQTLTKTVAG